MTSSPAPRPLYSVTREEEEGEEEEDPPVRTMVPGLVWMEQWPVLSCWRVKPSLLSPPSQGSSSVAQGELCPPMRRRPWLVTAEVWPCRLCRVLLQCCQPEGVSWSQLASKQPMRVSYQVSSVWWYISLVREGREQCREPGARTQQRCSQDSLRL